MSEIRTNKILVVKAGASVTVAVNGENRQLSWDDLLDACRQDDADLATIYGEIYRDACRLVADGPVSVSVHQDSSNVWWVCTVRSALSGADANYSRRADEGGTHPNHLLAALEAASICERLGQRVVERLGFSATDARAKRDQILAK